MNHEVRLARTLSSKSEPLSSLSYEELATLFKTANAAPAPKPPPAIAKSRPPPKPSPAIEGMKKSVGAMKESVKKLASADPVAIAEQWGRELAREDFEKTAIAFNMGAAKNMIATGINKAVPFLRPVVHAVRTATPGMAAGVGAAAGLARGVAKHYSKPKEERGSLLGSAAMNAAGGALGGLALRSGAQALVRQPGYRAAARGKFNFPTPAAPASPAAAAPAAAAPAVG